MLLKCIDNKDVKDYLIKGKLYNGKIKYKVFNWLGYSYGYMIETDNISKKFGGAFIPTRFIKMTLNRNVKLL